MILFSIQKYENNKKIEVIKNNLILEIKQEKIKRETSQRFFYQKSKN